VGNLPNRSSHTYNSQIPCHHTLVLPTTMPLQLLNLLPHPRSTHPHPLHPLLSLHQSCHLLPLSSLDGEQQELVTATLVPFLQDFHPVAALLKKYCQSHDRAFFHSNFYVWNESALFGF